MQKIVEGVARFHRSGSQAVQPLLAHLAKHGQRPQAMMITCADSRIMPEDLTQAEPGDLFILRNIGNLVPRPDQDVEKDVSVGAGIDYALEQLNIRDLVIMGHSGCGAMQALMGWEGGDGNINSWLRHGRFSRARLNSTELYDQGLNECDRLSQLNVLQNVENLTYYESVRRHLMDGSLTLHAWWLDVPNARVLAYNDARGLFVPIEQAYFATSGVELH